MRVYDDEVECEAVMLAKKMKETIRRYRESNANNERQERIDTIAQEIRSRWAR